MKEFTVGIAYVSQNSVVVHLTVRDNILLGVEKADEEIYGVLKQVHLLERVGKLSNKWDTIISMEGSNLSSGEEQCFLARVFIREMALLVGDNRQKALKHSY